MIQPLKYCFLTMILFVLAEQYCFSQSTSYHVRYSTSFRNFMAKCQIKTQDNGSFIAGKYGPPSEDSADIMIMKLDEYGKLLYSKAIPIKERVENFVLKEMSDGSIAIAIDIAFVNVRYYSDILLLKIDCKGDVLWSTRLSMDASIPKSVWMPMNLQEGKNGDILFSHFMHNTVERFSALSRLDNSGNIIWSKTFKGMEPDAYYTAPVFYQDNKLFMFGFANVYRNAIVLDKHLYAMRLNYDNGAIELQKSYNYNERYLGGLIVTQPKIHFNAEQLTDKTFALFGISSHHSTNQDFYLYKIIVDADLTIKNTQEYNIPYYIGITRGRIMVLPNGDTHITSDNYDVETHYWFTADNANNIIRAKKIKFPGSNLYSGSKDIFLSGPNRTTFYTNEITGTSYGIRVTQVVNNDNKIDPCLGADTPFVKLLPFTNITTGAWNWASIQDGKVMATPYPVGSVDITVNVGYFCSPDMVSAAPFKITGPAAVCASQSTYTFHVSTANSSYKPVQWKMGPAFYQSLQTINDSTVAITFNNPTNGPYKVPLIASAGNCQPVSDTLYVDVLPGLSLPPSVTVCNGHTETIHAGYWFASYRWQDGSTDSVYTISRPGRYILQVTTHCNETITDTIDAFGDKTGLVFNASVCPGDTTILTAPAGFTNYSWSPDYNRFTISDRETGVYPEKDTFYILSSESLNGCPLRDTVYITIKETPFVTLGPDTIVCEQEDIILDPGNGYLDYTWSTGAASPTLTVTQAGAYAVTVTGNNGCIASDTVQVTSQVCPKRFYMPNAFSPNNDGKNDVFKPYTEGNMESYELVVYNRWGGIVFKTNRVKAGWDGNSSAHLQSTGTYVWVCRYKFRNRPVKVEKGIVTLVR